MEAAPFVPRVSPEAGVVDVPGVGEAGVDDCDVSSLQEWSWDVPVYDVPAESEAGCVFEFPVVGGESVLQADSLFALCSDVVAPAGGD